MTVNGHPSAASHYDDQIERERRHQQARDRLEAEQQARNGEHKDDLKAQTEALDARLQAGGAGRFFRDLTGRTARDEEERANLERTMASIESREAEELATLQARQQAELDAQPAEQDQATSEPDRRPQQREEPRPPHADLEMNPPGMGGRHRGFVPDPPRQEEPGRSAPLHDEFNRAEAEPELAADHMERAGRDWQEAVEAEATQPHSPDLSDTADQAAQHYQSAAERHYAEIFTADAFSHEPDWYREAVAEQENEPTADREQELAEQFRGEAEAAMDQPARDFGGRDM